MLLRCLSFVTDDKILLNYVKGFLLKDLTIYYMELMQEN